MCDINGVFTSVFIVFIHLLKIDSLKDWFQLQSTLCSWGRDFKPQMSSYYQYQNPLPYHSQRFRSLLSSSTFDKKQLYTHHKSCIIHVFQHVRSWIMSPSKANAEALTSSIYRADVIGKQMPHALLSSHWSRMGLLFPFPWLFMKETFT